MIYLHVPFCKSFCAYCDFYSEVCPANESARAQKLFADGVCREINARRQEIAAADGLRTLYVGNGTRNLQYTIVSARRESQLSHRQF